jgi:hypothetical protein
VTSELGRRVSAEEAAVILGVQVHLISRLDPHGEWIKRYKLTRKTHVYDVQSLYAYLEAKLITPVPPQRRVDPQKPRYVPKMPGEPFSLLEFLPKKLENKKK